MSSAFRDTNQGDASPNWVNFLLVNIRIVIFITVALGGMLAAYWYFTPVAMDVTAVAAAGDGALSATIDKGATNNPVMQRFAQSPPPETIGIIVGHRDSDSGAVCDDGLTELDVNTNIAEQVAAELRSRSINTILLSEFDPRLTNFRGTALISIHADSCGYYNELATGYKIAQTSFNDSSLLEGCMEREYGLATQLGYHANTITQHMTDYHAFREISSLTPAIILETGFMNLDRELLTTNAALPIQGIVNGIVCFLDTQS